MRFNRKRTLEEQATVFDQTQALGRYRLKKKEPISVDRRDYA